MHKMVILDIYELSEIMLTMLSQQRRTIKTF